MKEFFDRVADFFSDPLYMWIGIGVGAAIVIAIVVGIAVGVTKSKRKKAAKRAAEAQAIAPEATVADAPAAVASESSEPAVESDETARDDEPGRDEDAPAEPLEEATAVCETEPEAKAEPAPDVSGTDEPKNESGPVRDSDAPDEPADEDAVPDAPAQAEKAEPTDEPDAKTQSAPDGEAEPATKPAPKTVRPKSTTAKPAAKKPAKPVQTVQKASINTSRGGKWVVKQQRADEYVACLHANNGELLLESEIYATAQGAKNGIDTIKKNILLGNFGIHRDKNGNYFYKLKSGTNRLLCVGEVYSTKSACESAIDSVKRFSMRAPTATEIEEDLSVIDYVPKDTAIVEAKAGHTGKWQIKELDADAYVACLYANNGELLLVSEDYASVAGAKGAIETIKKNAFANNFIIDRNKAGKYCFKLRNAVKSTICVGEVYDKQTSVEQTIESVKRFCQTANLEDIPDKKPTPKK